MRGMMMDIPLTIKTIANRARSLNKDAAVVEPRPGGDLRTTLGQVLADADRLVTALRKLGVQRGDRVATIGTNTIAHFKTLFAVPLMGAVLHPLNFRLPPEHLAYIVNHAEDRIIFAEPMFLPLLGKIIPSLAAPPLVIVMGERPPTATGIGGMLEMDQLIAGHSPAVHDTPIEESDAAALLYTSGTTGHPKGVLYSHRSIYLHALAQGLADSCSVSRRDTVMHIAPIFHCLAWGLPHAAALFGAAQVFPGADLSPDRVIDHIEKERVTYTGGVPTLWVAVLDRQRLRKADISSLTRVIVAGSAPPPAMVDEFRTRLGVTFLQAWGMTETGPLATANAVRAVPKGSACDPIDESMLRQGAPVPGIELRSIEKSGAIAPWDGETLGELEIRGPWVAAEYYRDPQSKERFHDDWLRTGDIVSIDPSGRIKIVDRAKDLVKSGGEWISTVELEGTLAAHADVAECAVIAVPHPLWQERPLACVVARESARATIDKKALLDFLAARFPRWYVPDDVVFIDALPRTSVGKIDKKALRLRFSAG